MSFFKNYIEYLKDNPKGLWFKRRLYGWGWVPVKWQGWVVVLAYVAFLVLFGLTIDETSPENEVIFTFLFPVVLLTLVLIRICYKKGERPYWQWGMKNETKNQPEHYICLGGCRGVSPSPGVCQAPDCASHNHELVKCDCTDGLHNDFKPKQQ